MAARVVIIGVGVVLRLALLAGDDLWYDEAFTALVARLPWAEAWPAILGDIHPPLWYVISRPFAAGPEWLLRLPAALCSVAALLLFAWWLEQLDLSPRAHLIALVLMALAPAQLRLAPEARMYAALELAALAMLVGLTLDRPVLLAAGVAFAPWLHHLGWLYVVVAGGGWLIMRRPVRPLLVGALALAVPAAAIGAWQFAVGMGDGYWIQARSVGAWLHHAHFAQTFTVATTPPWLAWHAGLAALALSLIGLLALRSHPLIVTFAWLPGLMLLLISQWRPMLLYRPLIGTAPAIFAVAGVGLARIASTRKRTWALAGMAAPLLLAPLALQAGGAARRSVRPLYEAAADCGMMVHTEPSSWMLAQYYGPAEQQHYLWHGWVAGVATGGLTQATERAAGVERAALASAHCWVVVDHAVVSDAQRTALAQATDGMRPDFVLESNEFLEVALYRR